MAGYSARNPEDRDWYSRDIPLRQPERPIGNRRVSDASGWTGTVGNRFHLVAIQSYRDGSPTVRGKYCSHGGANCIRS